MIGEAYILYILAKTNITLDEVDSWMVVSEDLTLVFSENS